MATVSTVCESSRAQSSLMVVPWSASRSEAMVAVVKRRRVARPSRSPAGSCRMPSRDATKGCQAAWRSWRALQGGSPTVATSSVSWSSSSALSAGMRPRGSWSGWPVLPVGVGTLAVIRGQLGRRPISSRNSDRVLGSLRKTPVSAEVTVWLFCF